MEYKLSLSGLIDTKTLQGMQSAFSKMTGIAVVTADADGAMVTQGSKVSEFCKYCMQSVPDGRSRCEQCNKQGAEMALKKGKAVAYTCHAGLVDFAAPIIVQDELIGCFIGGQVLLKKPDLNKVKQYAVEIGADPDKAVEVVQKLRIVSQEELDSAIDFLYTLADLLSDITFSRNLLFQANLELGKSVNMKSDFLANMSHEIRTPMNAVIGMAEMALREELPTIAREYINQIKVAGKTLLAIINDILDFSKIESGKMNINLEPYEPLSVLNDVANIIVTRLKTKEVELILDINPHLPYKLEGDSVRLKQIILNLANNAAKFTSAGKILLRMDFAKISEKEVKLFVTVEDTGIGIKKADIGKLFQSFSQVDSKRNRNIEGTGLGLAISKQLLSLMNGDIHVESEYEKGSIFSFELPQKIVSEKPGINIKETETMYAVGLLSNAYVKEQLQKDITNLGVEYRELNSGVELYTLPKERKLFCFIEQSLITAPIEEFVRENPEITVVVLTGFHSEIRYDIASLIVVKKPVFVLNLAMIFNKEDMGINYHNDSGDQDFDFIAPDAEVLIVDDNAVNLTVAEGLLEPLQMKIDTALSGKEAIGKISVNHYDIVFMDHMMPEVDGIETTHIIRRFHTEYNDVPIIALTANAIDGTREMFCAEGMNDFIAKPIEVRVLISKVKQWLSPEKIQRVYHSKKLPDKVIEETSIVIGDLDIVYALGILGSEKLFWTVLKEYYRVIEKKADLIKSLEEKEDWTGYTIEVHALKSASKQIGAISLSEKAAAMEKAGNARDTKRIHECTDEMLEQYLDYKVVLEPFCAEEEEQTAEQSISKDTLDQCLEDMRCAVEELDMDQMEAVIGEMGQYYYEGWQRDLFKRLKEAVDEVDVDSCEDIIQEWENREEK